MDKHTPGPWSKAARLNGPWWHISGPQSTERGQGRQAVACVHGESRRGSKFYSEMFEANARLIAAAPELLDALRSARCCVKDGSAVAERIDAAIAKATKEPTR
jgi:hypothetical protein